MGNINKILNLSKSGYKKNSPDVNNPFNVIPSNEITMKEDDGTPLKKGPILGIGIGKILEYKKMMPGKDYKFSDDVEYVIEKPLNEYEHGGAHTMMQDGGPKSQAAWDKMSTRDALSDALSDTDNIKKYIPVPKNEATVLREDDEYIYYYPTGIIITNKDNIERIRNTYGADPSYVGAHGLYRVAKNLIINDNDETSLVKEQPNELTGLTKQVPKTVWKQLPNGTWYKDTKAGQNATVESTGTDIGGRKFQLGGQYTPKERMGVRQNPDGSVSSHLMMSEVLPNGNWVSFPSLFQNEDGSWVDMSEKTSWYPIYLEALKRGEVYNFGKNKEAALEFGRGSWKTDYKYGGNIPKFQTGDEKKPLPNLFNFDPAALNRIYQDIKEQEKIQSLPEQQIYATPESRKKYEDVYAKAQSIAKAFPRAAEYFTKNKRYKNQGIEGISEYIQDITNYQKNAEDYYKARQAVKRNRMSTANFEKAYRERGWQQFDNKNVKTSEEDQKQLEETWYGPTDEQGRRYWMSNPMNVAEASQMLTSAAVLGAAGASFAPIAGSTVSTGSSSLLSRAGQLPDKFSRLATKGLTTPAVVGGKTVPWLTAGNLLDAYSLAMVPKIAGKTYDAFSEGDYYGGAAGLLETGFYGLGAMNPLIRTQLADDLTSLYSGSKQALNKITTQTPLKNAYNKVATGNSRLPIAWKMENINDATPLLKNKYNLTDEEAFVLGKYINTPYSIQRGTEESKIFDNLIKRNSAVLDEVNTPITKVLDHSTQTGKDVVPSTFGSTFTFPGNRSWSAGVDPRFVDTGRRRLVIPSKYSKDLGFTAVPYDDTRLVEGWNASSGSNPLTKLNMSDEKELIGNIPEGYKVIGRSNEGGFENIFIKPNTKFSNQYKQGGTIPKFQTGDEKKPLPNLFNFTPTPEYVGYQGNVPVSESTRVVNTYRPTQQEIKATKEYAQKVGATAQAIRNKTGVSQKEAIQQAEQVLEANSRVQAEAKPYANTKQAQERDAYVFDEGMNARDYFRYPLQFLSGNLPTQEERIQDRIRITDPRTSRVDKFMGTVGEAGSLAPEALLNTGIGLAFAPANLSKLGMVADAVSPIGNPFHPDFIKSINKAGDYLTTQTPLKNAYKLNPLAPKLGQYNRVVGQDAIDDIIQSGLVRVQDKAGVAIDLGPFGIVNRTTPYPSFAKAKPQQQYINQVVSQGKTPYVISTDRPMKASNLARHGKGKTQFPINDEGKYISGFPASEAQVYEATPHWLRGYKPIETPTSPFNTRAQNDLLVEQARRSGEAPLPSYMEPFLLPSKAVRERNPEFFDYMQSVKETFRPINKNTKVRKTDPFKSEIDWGKWNPDTPKRTDLMKEYAEIERKAKSDGTWMKDSQGNPARLPNGELATPEQWVQSQSKAWEKSYGSKGFENLDETYIGRGNIGASDDLSPTLRFPTDPLYGKSVMSNPDGNMMGYYTHNSGMSPAKDWDLRELLDKFKITASNINDGPNYPLERPFRKIGVHDLILPKSKNTLSFDAKQAAWNTIDNPDIYDKIKALDSKIEGEYPSEKLVSTDMLAKYLDHPLQKEYNRVSIKNVDDAFPGKWGEVLINKQEPGNYYKSLWGNVGDFDLSNPNIYKALIPAAIATGAAASSNEYKQGGMVLDLSEDEIKNTYKIKYPKIL